MATKGWVGPLIQAKEGRQPWVCDFTCPLSGKRKRRKIAEAGANKKDRERLYHDFRHSLTDGRMITRENATFGDAIDLYEKWCEQRHATGDRMSAGSMERIAHAIRVHLRPDLGHMLLEDFSSPLVQDYVYRKSETYRALHFELYQQIALILDRAVWQDLLSISPLDVKKVRMPQRPRSTRTIPTVEEGRALYHALEHEGRSNGRISSHCNISRMTTVALSMFGGMRAGEMAGLQWENIDFIERMISVRHSLSRYGGLKEPKAASSYRYIVMSPEMNYWLTETGKRDGYPSTGFMLKPEPGNRNRNWTTDEGNHLLRSMTSQFQAAQVRLGFVNDDGKARWTMHEMRHYAGSVWLALGMRLEDVSRMLGHGKLETTQKYYIHQIKKLNIDRDRPFMMKMSEIHRALPGQKQAALPSPMRDLCEINGEAIEE